MDKELRILILEDVDVDAELTELELRKGGIIFIAKHVAAKDAFLKELEEFLPDVILSDYSLPQFDGLSALLAAKEKNPDVLFLMVSGTIGEELAIEILKKGATDYVSKSNLKRLVPAINRALKEAEERLKLKQMKKSLQESEKLYRLLAENTYDMITRHLPDSTYLYVSPASRILFGYEPEELIGTKAFDQMHPEDVRKVIAISKEAVRTGGSYVGQYRHLNKYGQYIWVETAGKVIKKEDTGAIEDIICVVRDITERKADEEALRASEAELHSNYFTQTAITMILNESLENIPLELVLQKVLNMILSIPGLSFESVGSMYLVENESGCLVIKARYNLPEQVNNLCAHLPSGKCLCGQTALTQKIRFIDHIDECHEICYEGMAPHGHYFVPIVFCGRTLGIINIYLQEGHIRDEKEEEFLRAVADTLSGIIVRRQAEDERERMHAQLLQAQKMEAIGQLAGGIAHDFNNILTAMMGYAHILKTKMREDDPLRTYADHVLSLSDRAASLTQSLLAFSRKQVMNPRATDMNEIIRTVERLLLRIIGEDIQPRTVLSEKDLIVMADHGQIEQVLMNLATNARDAMPEGGSLTIGTETMDIDDEFIKEHGFGKKGPYALVSITDTGMGMDRETREKIFEPFFTTKEVGKGTGLGLSMVYGIVKQHDGFINVYSEPGKGTTFRIYLPLIQEKMGVEEAKSDVLNPPETGTETILLAEDEKVVREFIKKLLEDYGYKVIEAIDGGDAINRFKLYKDKIQFVLLDIIMPEKNAREVYENIRQINPNIKALFMSGYTADMMLKKRILEDGFDFIEKPLSPTKLLRKVREILDK